MLQTNTNKLFNKIPDPLANIFERSLRRTWHFFVYATNTTPPVSSKPSRIFRSLSVFTKNSWSWYVNFKYWFPMSSFIELRHEAALHMFETLILHNCACILSALCIIFFYLENICFPFHRVGQNICSAVPRFESIVGEDWAPGLGPTSESSNTLSPTSD